MKAGFVLSFLVAASLGFSEDWPQWRGPERTGVARVPGPSVWPETLDKRWQLPVGIGHSSPVAVSNRVFQFSREAERETVRAIGLEDGKVLWEDSYDAPYRMNPAATGHGKGPKSTPLAVDSMLFTLGIEGMLSCHDQRTGKLIWRSDFRERFPRTSPAFGSAMSPLMAKGKLLVHLGGPSRGALMALDPKTGKPVWANEIDGPGSASPIVATIGGVDIVVTQTERLLIGASLESGDTLFRIPFTTPYDQNIVTPVLHGDRLIFGGLEASTIAIELERDGNAFRTREVWTTPVSFYMSTPVLTEGRLVGMSNKKRGQFVALDAATGETLWEGEGRAGENAAVVALGEWLLLLTEQAELFVLPAGATSFSPARRYQVADSPTWAHPVPTSKGILIKDETTLSLWSYE